MEIKGAFNKSSGWIEERDWVALGVIFVCGSLLYFDLSMQAIKSLLLCFGLSLFLSLLIRFSAKLPYINKPVLVCSGEDLAIKAHYGKVINLKHAWISSYKEYPTHLRIYWSDKIDGGSKSVDIDKNSLSIEELIDLKTKILSRYKCLTNCSS